MCHRKTYYAVDRPDDVTPVDTSTPLNEPLDTDTGLIVSIGDGPLDRCCTPVLWQEGRMDVEPFVGLEPGQEQIGNDVPKRRGDEHVVLACACGWVAVERFGKKVMAYTLGRDLGSRQTPV